MPVFHRPAVFWSGGLLILLGVLAHGPMFWMGRHTHGQMVAGVRQLLRGRHAPLTWALLLCGTGWGLVNFGFLLWRPPSLTALGVDAAAASALLARSAVYALPGIAVVVWL